MSDFDVLCIHHLFERQAQMTPQEVAALFPELGPTPTVTQTSQHVTYIELNRRANQLAHHLCKLGVGPEVVVGLYAEPSLELLVGLLAILKAGGSYLPLAPSYPTEHLVLMLEDTQAPVLLVAAENRRRAADSEPQKDYEPILNNQWSALSNQRTLVDLVANWPTIAQERTDNLANTVLPDNLAYVIYTSGSTGRPKGVQVTHRALVSHSRAIVDAYGLQPSDRVLQFAALSFDLAAEEIFPTWSCGAAVVLRPSLNVLSFAEFMRLIEQVPLSVLNLPTTYWHAWVADLACIGAKVPASLRLVVIGTDQALAERLVTWHELTGEHIRTINAYGVTEATITTTVYPVDTIDRRVKADRVPIGRPIVGTQVYVLDQNLQLVTAGAVGELYLGGASLARGYLGKPDLTAERFIPNPFTYPASTGSRLYRTGDLGRILPDGNIEFLGRADDQVKIRGVRIEPGAIESLLRQHLAVQEVVVQARANKASDRQLVAYIVPSRKQLRSCNLEEAAQVERWQTIYDEIYHSRAANTDVTFNIAGWNSSYTGQPIPDEEMIEWLEYTVEHILALRPRRVLEIGCGTGMLLFRIAPHCERYHATDISQAAIDYLRRILALPNYALPHVTLCQQAADDFAGIKVGGFDVVVLNSVTQHFPDAAYLVEVLRGAVQIIKAGGAIFVGDVRSLPLLGTFHTSVQLHQASDALLCSELRHRVWRRVAFEEELVVDPALFAALSQELPRISRSVVQLKRGRCRNEMACFRYDVTLHIEGDDVEGPDDRCWLDWTDERLTLAAVCGCLTETQPAALGMRRVPNARLLDDARAGTLLASIGDQTTVGELRAALRAIPQDAGVDPEDLWELGTQLDYAVSITWSGGEPDGHYDVVFQQRPRHTSHEEHEGHKEGLNRLRPGWLSCDTTKPAERRPWHVYTNNPAQARFQRSLITGLRQHLASQLPDSMIPAAFVLLDALPLGTNGKIDRNALPLPEHTTSSAKDASSAPRTATEERLATIWSELLDIRYIGAHDNFFALGGHSLLATQLISRIRDAFQIELPLRMLFEPPAATLTGLAGYIETARWVADSGTAVPETDHEQGEL